jgi:hypothetical protein
VKARRFGGTYRHYRIVTEERKEEKQEPDRADVISEISYNRHILLYAYKRHHYGANSDTIKRITFLFMRINLK